MLTLISQIRAPQTNTTTIAFAIVILVASCVTLRTITAVAGGFWHSSVGSGCRVARRPSRVRSAPERFPHGRPAAWRTSQCLKNTLLWRRRPVGRTAFGAQHQGEDSSFSCWTAGQGLAQKECFKQKPLYIILYLSIYLSLSLSLHIYIYIYIHIYIYIYTHKHICMYTYVYISLSLYIYIYIYVYIRQRGGEHHPCREPPSIGTGPGKVCVKQC